MKEWKNKEELMVLIYEEVMALRKGMTGVQGEVGGLKSEVGSLS